MTRVMTQLPGKLRSRRSIRRLMIISAWLLIIHESFYLISRRDTKLSLSARRVLRISSLKPIDQLKPPHPITTRLESARLNWYNKVNSQSVNYPQFKSRYRSRYGLEPPDGMREWFNVVSADGFLLVDEFDEMMNSLKIFRTMDSIELERRTLEVASMPTFSLLNITERHAYFNGQNYRGDFKKYSRENYGPGLERVEGLASMMQRHIRRIPDGLLFAVSELAEPRVIVPWQDHPETLQSFDQLTSSSSQTIFKNYNLRLQPPSLKKLLPTPNFRESGSAWELYAKSCPPESSARKNLVSLKGSSAMRHTHQQALQLDRSTDPTRLDPIQSKLGRVKTGLAKRRISSSAPTITDGDMSFDPTGGNPNGFNDVKTLIDGSEEFSFVRLNYKGLTHPELCQDSELHQLQGAFFSDWRGLPALYPVFSPSKIDGYSVPSNFYYGDDARYTFQSNETIEWEDRHNKLFWRGKTTGGGNSPPRHQMQYQRHRFVRMAESLSTNLKSLLIPKSKNGLIYHVKKSIVELNRAWMDVGFTGYTGCGEPDICSLTERIFRLKKPVPLSEMAKYKAILDLDGMAFSGRFVALMSMGSGVLKATIFRDAFTDWVEPWVHYIPLSSGYSELYNILGYFLPLPNSEESEKLEEQKKLSWIKQLLTGTTMSNEREGDKQLRRVAEDGLKWSKTVGNKADIEAYVYRLALEWGRLTGKVGDETIDEDEENEIKEFEEDEKKRRAKEEKERLKLKLKQQQEQQRRQKQEQEQEQ
ncbi:hypothetical protein BY996DRAFT_4602863 [Phakopsora pachyrhizi]|uniref:Glycosyl transferase CAP10 domain-containing protein n=1 Tax=Phakopsora pachyrhizi TaxID=170000 RepID=A0AAV0BGD1_PHAPC|nr:hypothetical protein BY996DRAFT_4602863 [Phakopsora pachyrhizi]CAH7686231.1 hypothetical protein PPACK8108_LOCUS20853 [Phakopsora pachyrhizi]